jgi:hypothetical protein
MDLITTENRELTTPLKVLGVVCAAIHHLWKIDKLSPITREKITTFLKSGSMVISGKPRIVILQHNELTNALAQLGQEQKITMGQDGEIIDIDSAYMAEMARGNF